MTKEEVIDDYNLENTDIDDIKILFHEYDCYGYEGESLTIFKNENTGEIGLINSSHCSCNGLEWDPTFYKDFEEFMRNIKTFESSTFDGFKEFVIKQKLYEEILKEE